MTSKPITTSKTVKLKNIVPDLIVTPLANKIANKTQVTSHTVQVSKAEVIKKLEFMNRVVARTEVKNGKQSLQLKLLLPFWLRR